MWRIREGHFTLQAGALILMAGGAALAGTEDVRSIAELLQSEAAVADGRWEEEEVDSYYWDEDGDKEVNTETVGKGIGECGAVKLSKSLWDRTLPSDLLSAYVKRMKSSAGVGEITGVGVVKMLSSLVEGGSLKRRGGALGKVRVIPKNLEKCNFTLNCMKHNACDHKTPEATCAPAGGVVA